MSKFSTIKSVVSLLLQILTLQYCDKSMFYKLALRLQIRT